MDRCAIFIDAGYAYAAGGLLCCGAKARHLIDLSAAGLVGLLDLRAQQACRMPVLRTYWYDGAKDGVPTLEQQSIADLPNVKLRLGRINAQNEQKGVDSLIYRDLMTLGRERAIADAFLISGDEDLREGVRAAQDMGVRVTLVGIAVPTRGHNQSRELVWEADEVITLTAADLEAIFTRRAGTTPSLPLTPPPQGASTGSIATPGPSLPSEEDAKRVGEGFGATWWARATEDDRSALQAVRPSIPRTLDGELCREVETTLGVSLRNNEPLRKAGRRGFWASVPRSSTPTAG